MPSVLKIMNTKSIVPIELYISTTITEDEKVLFTLNVTIVINRTPSITVEGFYFWYYK